MISRIPKKKIELNGESLFEDKRNKIILEYYLLESDIEDIEELKGMRTFGVEIVKNAGGAEETTAVKNVSASRSEMNEIIGLLSRNSVTPVTLTEVLDDIIGVWA